MKRHKSERRILKEFDQAGFFDVISFEGEVRVFSYYSLDAVHAAKFAMEQTIVGRQVMLFPAGQLHGSLSNKKVDFEQRAKEIKQKQREGV